MKAVTSIVETPTDINEQKPNPSPENDPHAAVRERIMNTYYNVVDDLNAKIEKNKSEVNPRDPKKVTVVVSLWSEDDGLLANKMFGHSLDDLLNQAAQEDLNLDIIIVANNGGGATEEIGNAAMENLTQMINNNPKIQSTNVVDTIQPEGETDAATPWDIPFDMKGIRKPSDKNGVLIVRQQHNKLNGGKIRALRDTSKALVDAVSDGYHTDAILQIDAETILNFRDPALGKINVTPLKVMLNGINRGGLTAVGTKDQFAIMDQETGKPIDKPIGSAQKGYEATNKGLVTLPGGALMSRPANYIAAMTSLSEHTPLIGTEDYAYTAILRQQAKDTGVPIDHLVKSIDIIGHLNRTPENWKASIQQMAKWYAHARAVDAIFPDKKYGEPFHKYVGAVVKARIQDAFDRGDVSRALRLVQDLREIPGAIGFLTGSSFPDITDKGAKGVTWTLNAAQRQKEQAT